MGERGVFFGGGGYVLSLSEVIFTGRTSVQRMYSPPHSSPLTHNKWVLETYSTYKRRYYSIASFLQIATNLRGRLLSMERDIRAMRRTMERQRGPYMESRLCSAVPTVRMPLLLLRGSGGMVIIQWVNENTLQ